MFSSKLKKTKKETKIFNELAIFSRSNNFVQWEKNRCTFELQILTDNSNQVVVFNLI